MAWTDELVDRMKTLNENGLSCTKIAADLGNGITRNAVIGKLHRLGIVKVPANVTPRVRGVVRKPRNGRGFEPAFRPSVKTPWRPGANPRAGIPHQPRLCLPPRPATLLSIWELTATTCRWPYGDPGDPAFGFCGCHVQWDVHRNDFSPWCPEHHARAHQDRWHQQRAALA